MSVVNNPNRVLIIANVSIIPSLSRDLSSRNMRLGLLKVEGRFHSGALNSFASTFDGLYASDRDL